MVNLSFSLVTFEYFLMIVVRVASFVAVAPFYGTNNWFFRNGCYTAVSDFRETCT